MASVLLDWRCRLEINHVSKTTSNNSGGGMKKAIGVFFSLCMLGIANIANAIPFTSTIDYSTDDENFIIIDDLNSTASVGLYTHTVTFDLEADSEARATLILSFAKTNANETWEIYEVINKEAGVLGNKPIGVLDKSQNTNEQLTQEFDLSDLSSFKSAASGSSWTFSFTFLETTNGSDSFSLARSEISVYTVDPIIRAESLPVPEPGTIILLSAGLIGMVVLNRHKFTKK